MSKQAFGTCILHLVEIAQRPGCIPVKLTLPPELVTVSMIPTVSLGVGLRSLPGVACNQGKDQLGSCPPGQGEGFPFIPLQWPHSTHFLSTFSLPRASDDDFGEISGCHLRTHPHASADGDFSCLLEDSLKTTPACQRAFCTDLTRLSPERGFLSHRGLRASPYALYLGRSNRKEP